jgi:hypothetical protein
MVSLDTGTRSGGQLAAPEGTEPPRPPLPPRDGGDENPRRSRGLLEAATALVATLGLIGGLYLVGSANDGPEDDKGLSQLQNGHMHEVPEDVPLDAATQEELDRQLALTKGVMDKYPTLADAKEAGFAQAGPFVAALGTHMINYKAAGLSGNPDGVIDDTDIANPMSLIYDGYTDDAELAGFMYYSFKPVEDGPPEGFAGPNDHWHYHDNVCIGFEDGTITAPLGADLPVTAAQCEAVGGRFIDQTTWMVHVWTVPGYESERGVFSDLNPSITCPNGEYYIVDQSEWVKYSKSICKDAPA